MGCFLPLDAGESCGIQEVFPVALEVRCQSDEGVEAAIAAIPRQHVAVRGDDQFGDGRFGPIHAEDISDDGCHLAGHVGKSFRMQFVGVHLPLQYTVNLIRIFWPALDDLEEICGVMVAGSGDIYSEPMKSQVSF